MASVNRQWIFTRPLDGPLKESHFALRTTPVPGLRQGQALIRQHLISIDPANRLYLAMQSYRPQVFPGDVMAGFGIGEVIESTDPRFRKGDLWHGDFGWQDYAVINSYDRQEYFHRCTPGHDEAALIGVFGITGMTAWFGVSDILKPEPGDTAVVAGATGACGSIIAQLLRERGCRIVAIGGGPEKCRWLRDELGVDQAVDYRAPDLADALADACPQGVQMFSDGVGGDASRAVLPLMRRGARWYHYGNLTTYADARSDTALARNDAFLTGTLRAHCSAESLKPRFLLVFDRYCARLEAEAGLAALIAGGKLKAQTTELQGFECLPEALVTGGGGARLGKLNIRIAASGNPA